MRVMTAVALALGNRRVCRFLVYAGGYCLVAGIAECRWFLTEEDAADKTVRQMALVAAVIFNRGMDIPLFELFSQLRMAVETFFGHCSGRPSGLNT